MGVLKNCKCLPAAVFLRKSNMQKIKVGRSKLLIEVKKNRTSHEKAYKEAVIGYRQASIEKLEQMLADAKNGKAIQSDTNLEEPETHLAEYDRIIKQLELTSDHIIELHDQEFNQYVMDEWNWKHKFMTTNSFYSNAH